jgi:hypothetical protein
LAQISRKIISLDEKTYDRLLQHHSKVSVPDSFAKLLNRLMDVYEEKNNNDNKPQALETAITN